ncbi:MAG: peroxide stress protein YaaA [Anaerolineae bacterium]
MVSSQILFVTICSNGKVQGPNRPYDASTPLHRLLPRDEGRLLLEGRQRAYDLLRNPVTERGHEPVKGHPYNRELRKDGPDFGGSAQAPVYLPAMERYDGRFYVALGEARREQLQNPRHHLLIISGLYGLLHPEDSIQLYSLHVPDHGNMAKTWCRDGALTRVLQAYIDMHEIKRVFELCGTEVYRSLVDWHRLGPEVLHAFGNMNAGDAVLTALGRAAAELLHCENDDLLTLPSGHTLEARERVVLTVDRHPPEGYPREVLLEDIPEPEREPPSIRPEVPITSGGHHTLFGSPVDAWEDLPAEARDLLLSVARAPEVESMRLAAFTHRGKTPKYVLKLHAPTSGSGQIQGELSGPGKIGGTQSIAIRVTVGQEASAFQYIRRHDQRIGMV